MKRLVIKFGGTALMDTMSIQRCAEIAVNAQARGFQVVTIVSAMGHTTDQLLSLAQDLSHEPDPREIDLLLVTGEQISATLMTIAIQSLGIKACSFSGETAGMITEKCHGNAPVKEIRGQALEQCLSDGYMPVVAGFQGITEDGAVTTLGRGGSDTTAIALAAHLGAERCDIYTDVNGVYSADPHILKDAFKLPMVSYEDMLELARNGAQVLNPRSVEIAISKGVSVRVRSAFEPGDEGTLITRLVEQESLLTGIACAAGKLCLKLTPADKNGNGNHKKPTRFEGQGQPDWQEKLIALLTRAGIYAEIGTYPFSHDQELGLSISKTDGDKLKSIITEANGDLDSLKIKSETSVASVSIVGTILQPFLEMEAIRALAQETIPIELVQSSSRRLSLYVPEPSRDLALRLLHASLCGQSGAA